MKSLWLVMLMACFPAFAGVSDLKQSSTAGRLSQVSDDYTPTASRPTYQTTDIGGTWTPDISLDNSSGTPESINLNNGSGKPSIDLGNATGSIANTSGTNSSISSAISSNSTKTVGSWVKSARFSTTGFEIDSAPSGSCSVGTQVWYSYSYGNNNERTYSGHYVCK